MELFLLYLWLKINTFAWCLGVLGVVLVITGICCWLQASEYKIEDLGYTKWWKWGMRYIIAAPLVFTLGIALPSKTDIAILVGASVALDMAKSPEGVKVGTLLRGKVNEVLDEAIKEMTPKKP